MAQLQGLKNVLPHLQLPDDFAERKYHPQISQWYLFGFNLQHVIPKNDQYDLFDIVDVACWTFVSISIIFCEIDQWHI